MASYRDIINAITFGRRGTKAFTTAAPTNAATLLLAANPARRNALLVNNGSVTVYLGNTTGVTTANGIPLAAAASLFDESSVDAWYGITAAVTGDVRIAEVS